MMRTMAILGVLLSQAVSVCGPATMVVCVHQGGRAHIELLQGACCHEKSGTAHAHPATLDHDHQGQTCPAHLVCGRAQVDRCGDESGPCTDYPLVISQLRSAQQRGTTLASDSLPCIDVAGDHLPTRMAAACHGQVPSRAAGPCSVLTSLSTVMLRC